jgi:hypothetical protein
VNKPESDALMQIPWSDRRTLHSINLLSKIYPEHYSVYFAGNDVQALMIQSMCSLKKTITIRIVFGCPRFVRYHRSMTGAEKSIRSLGCFVLGVTDIGWKDQTDT